MNSTTAVQAEAGVAAVMERAQAQAPVLARVSEQVLEQGPALAQEPTSEAKDRANHQAAFWANHDGRRHPRRHDLASFARPPFDVCPLLNRARLTDARHRPKDQADQPPLGAVPHTN
jgi:hypothetical protein